MKQHGACESGSAGKAVFAQTLWTLVLKAGQDDSVSADALNRLARIYWYPVYAFIRRQRGQSHADAEDLTQSFFTHIIEKHTLLKASPEKGRFRTFLLTTLRNFLNNEWRRAHAERRGGQYQFVSINAEEAASRFEQQAASPATPERAYDRDMAMALIDGSMALLAEDYTASGRQRIFQALQPFLVEARDVPAHAALAAELGMKTDAVKMAISRMRRRFGEILWNQVAQIVADRELVDEELRHLLAAWHE